LLAWHGGHNKPYWSTDKIREKWGLSRHKGQVVKQLLNENGSLDAAELWDGDGK
jgi:hypothetical protein